MARVIRIVGAEPLPANLRRAIEEAGLSIETSPGSPEATESARATFVRDLVHELSTPITPLAGYLRILQGEKLGPLSPQQKKVLESMLGSVARLSRIIENLSDFANLQTSAANLKLAPVDPAAVVDEVIGELRAAIRDGQVHVTVTKSAGGAIVADGRKLKQAIANVLGNAIKFSPHGGEILVEVLREPEVLRVAVYDQGPGVMPTEQQAIFEPFHHAATRGADEARVPGTGLGLPVVRRIVEAHGGTVWVESPPRAQPGSVARLFSGAKFVLEIPSPGGSAA
ncbi:MAG TPA: HAMP domain-containing sensor histidine kinase [Anaeromyxobacteraceae bacterium]|nr:HAMP domain-containing sensor histidine kinase [Anaeromyxobacteraceae bacterium]